MDSTWEVTDGGALRRHPVQQLSPQASADSAAALPGLGHQLCHFLASLWVHPHWYNGENKVL